MGTQILLIFLGVIVQFCNVLGRNNFYEYYYSRYHKSHSTTSESTFPSTADIFSSEEHELESSSRDYISWEKTNNGISTPDDNSLESNTHEVTDDTSLRNRMYEPTGERHRFPHVFMSRTLLIVGSIVAFLIVVGVIVCCCPKCCRGTEYRSYTRRNNTEPASEVVPQQPIFVPYTGQQVAAQHFSVQYPQEQPLPEYQPQIMQQQPRWSEGQHLPVQYPQDHFPPEYQPQTAQTLPQSSLGQHSSQQHPQEHFLPEYQPQTAQQQPQGFLGQRPQCSRGQHFSQQHPQEHFLPEYQPQIAQQQPQCFLGQHSCNLPEAPPPYESHIKY